ncbi:hypothetical protein EGP91_05230 [bacterium]|nr:hypothetical protein [bacterium]
MKKNGYAIQELLILFALLGVIFAVGITKISYALEDAQNEEEIAEVQENNLLYAGELYVKKNTDKFTETDNYFYGSDLITDQILNDDNKDYSSIKFKATKEEDGSFKVEIVK